MTSSLFQACMAVVQYIHNTIQRIKSCLDGKNAENVLLELGIRLHRVIYEHLLQFQYNSIGAMIAIMDVNEYRKCVKNLNIPFVNTLFDTLHALCNLLLVKPENLKQVCSGETLVSVLTLCVVAYLILCGNNSYFNVSVWFGQFCFGELYSTPNGL